MRTPAASPLPPSGAQAGDGPEGSLLAPAAGDTQAGAGDGFDQMMAELMGGYGPAVADLPQADREPAGPLGSASPAAGGSAPAGAFPGSFLKTAAQVAGGTDAGRMDVPPAQEPDLASTGDAGPVLCGAQVPEDLDGAPGAVSEEPLPGGAPAVAMFELSNGVRLPEVMGGLADEGTRQAAKDARAALRRARERRRKAASRAAQVDDLFMEAPQTSRPRRPGRRRKFVPSFELRSDEEALAALREAVEGVSRIPENVRRDAEARAKAQIEEFEAEQARRRKERQEALAPALEPHRERRRRQLEANSQVGRGVGSSGPARVPGASPVVLGGGGGPLEGGFGTRLDEVVTVPASTRPRSSTPVKRSGQVPASPRSRGGRINEAELQFFRRLGSSRTAALAGDSEEVVRLLRDAGNPEAASPEEREARELVLRQALLGDKAFDRNERRRLLPKDFETLKFLALFRYASARHVARVRGTQEVSTLRRLSVLEEWGLVTSRRVYGTSPVWFITNAGMLLSGYSLKVPSPDNVSLSMFPHQFAVNHVASCLWGASLNVLELEDYPARNRQGPSGEAVLGEELVSEPEVLSSMMSVCGLSRAEFFVPQVKARMDSAYDDWMRRCEQAGKALPGPETVFGNEFMWALWPPAALRKAYHVPDLVVRRPRLPDGRPGSVAVEVELANKPAEAYQSTLLSYLYDERTFSQVVWVCRGPGPARKLETAAKDIGLWQQGRIKVLPIYNEDGVFSSRNLWLL